MSTTLLKWFIISCVLLTVPVSLLQYLKADDVVEAVLFALAAPRRAEVGIFHCNNHLLVFYLRA